MLRYLQNQYAVMTMRSALFALSLCLASHAATAQLTPIHDVQGSGATSPLTGQAVTVRGIVTAIKFNNGFFIQEPDALVDADPATSEGIFVFTSVAPPTNAVVGNLVQVTGTVAEFLPSTDPLSRSVTQLVLPTVVLLSTGNPLPAPIVLTTASLNPLGGLDQLERFEGMRVSIPSMTVVSPSEGTITESSATATTTGVFHGVITGAARAFREPGLDPPTIPIPLGSTPPIFDGNPEGIQVRSRGQTGTNAIEVPVGALVTGLVGVLDYVPRRYALLPDPGSGTVAGGAILRAVSAPFAEEVTIASVSLGRFFDEVNDSNGAVTLTAAGFDKRLNKASIAISDFLRAPDIVAVQEAENLRVLGLLADRINATSALAPQYVPYLIQGNDVGSLNLGFLVSTRTISPGVPRVDVVELVQRSKNTVLNNPDSSTSLLHDRPPLLLRVNVNRAPGLSWPVTVLNLHLRSRNGLDDTTPGSSGWPTEGDRVRSKRQKQAEDVATIIQARQLANANENIVVTGDFNAYEFNDGHAHLLGVISGSAAPGAETLVNETASPVTPPLQNLSLNVPSIERYNRTDRGNAELATHTLASARALQTTIAHRVEFARLNADFQASSYGVPGSAERFASQDPSVAYFLPKRFATLNVDDSGVNTRYRALSDGLAILRYLRAERGASLAAAAASDAARGTSDSIAAYLDALGMMLDVDGNGVKDDATDGLLILRFLLGIRDASLIANALASSPPATRTTAVEIVDYLNAMTP